jgi:hypothetical protein
VSPVSRTGRLLSSPHLIIRCSSAIETYPRHLSPGGGLEPPTTTRSSTRPSTVRWSMYSLIRRVVAPGFHRSGLALRQDSGSRTQFLRDPNAADYRLPQSWYTGIITFLGLLYPASPLSPSRPWESNPVSPASKAGRLPSSSILMLPVPLW